MYSVQDERLDLLKRKSSSVYIVESDNDFFVVLFKHINNSVRWLSWGVFSTLLPLDRESQREGKMEVSVSNQGKLRLFDNEKLLIK